MYLAFSPIKMQLHAALCKTPVYDYALRGIKQVMTDVTAQPGSAMTHLSTGSPES